MYIAIISHDVIGRSLQRMNVKVTGPLHLLGLCNRAQWAVTMRR